jgi:hypothetical protein
MERAVRAGLSVGVQTPDFPEWLQVLSSLSLALGVACALVLAVDVARRPQKMAVMNLVWPITALFGSLIWLAFYFRWGREGRPEPPFPVKVAKGASHCGAGCTLGDLVAEWLAFGFPAIALAFGWRSLFVEKTFAVWIFDYILAFLFGIAFQYFSIKPMRDLSPAEGLKQAVKADAASISAWQVGMYGMMAILQFAWFRRAYGALAPVNSPEFWWAMQVAMLAGFVASYPANWLLIRKGVKEAM